MRRAIECLKEDCESCERMTCDEGVESFGLAGAAVSFADAQEEVVMEGKLRNRVSFYLMKGDRMLLLHRIGSRVLRPLAGAGSTGILRKRN